MRIIFILMLTARLFAADECAKYFNERIDILNAKIAESDEARQEAESFKAAFLALQERKEAELTKREEELKKAQEQLKADQNALANDRAKLLKQVDEQKAEQIKKVALSYSKMKDAAAAAILEKMSEAEAIEILRALEAKKIASILPKMQPDKAAALSIKLKK